MTGAGFDFGRSTTSDNICHCHRPDIFAYDGSRICQGCGLVPAQAAQGRLHQRIEQKTELRILELDPEDGGEFLRARLVTRRIDDREEYSAISYTWADEHGDATKNCFIEINGTAFAVTQNCLAALNRVRSHRPYAKTRTWIDAICIDQGNLDERGHQVSLMPQIYSGAKVVYAYLGEHADDSDVVMEYLALDLNLLNGGILPGRAAFTSFFSRRYFSRIWVLQEISMARNAIVICGNNFLPWDVITEAGLSRTRPDPIDPWQHKSIMTIAFGVPDTGRPIKKVPSVLKIRYPNDGRREFDNKWLHLLDLGRECQAGEPRDKIFALLGLMAPTPETAPFTPDYRETTEKLFIDVALRIWRNYGSETLLWRLDTERKSRIEGLPSWVPDWTIPWSGKAYSPWEAPWLLPWKLSVNPSSSQDLKRPSHLYLSTFHDPGRVSRHFFDHGPQLITLLGFPLGEDPEKKSPQKRTTWCIAEFVFGGEKPGVPTDGNGSSTVSAGNGEGRLVSSIFCKVSYHCLVLERVGGVISHPPNETPDCPLWRFTSDAAGTDLIPGRDFIPSRSIYRLVDLQPTASRITDISISRPRMVCDADNNWELKSRDIGLSFRWNLRTTDVQKQARNKFKSESLLRTFSLC